MRVAHPVQPVISTNEFPFSRKKETYESRNEWRREVRERASVLKRIERSLKLLSTSQRTYNNQTILDLHETLSIENGTARAKAISLFKNRFKSRQGKNSLTNDEVVERVDLLSTAFIEKQTASNTLSILNDITALKKFVSLLKRARTPTQTPLSPPTIPRMTKNDEIEEKLFLQITNPFQYKRQL